jgi:TRAP-type C4-dicarboxylate transport system substrate-binding protein
MRSKRVLKCFAGFIAGIFLLLSFFMSSGYAADKIQLRLTTMFPQTHLHTVLHQKLADEIKKKTNGQVEITVYPVGTLTAPDKIYDSVVKGIADIGNVPPVWVAGRFHLSEIMEMPSDIPSAWVSMKVFTDLFQKFPFKEYDDVHVLYLHGPGRNMITTKNVPVRRLEDLKGQRLRSSGGYVDLLKAWGVVPRAMPMSEAYESLAKGVIDGAFAVAETLSGFKLAEPVKYLTIPPVSTSSCQCVVMNKKKWNALPDDIKKVFTEVSNEWPEKHSYVWMYYDKTGIDYFKSLGKGREIIVIPADQKPQWQKGATAVLEKYTADKQAMGLPMKEFVKYFQERVAYYIPKQPTEEQAVKWVETNLLKK